MKQSMRRRKVRRTSNVRTVVVLATLFGVVTGSSFWLYTQFSTRMVVYTSPSEKVAPTTLSVVPDSRQGAEPIGSETDVSGNGGVAEITDSNLQAIENPSVIDETIMTKTTEQEMVSSRTRRRVVRTTPTPTVVAPLPTPSPATNVSVGLSVADTLTGLSESELNRWFDDMVTLRVTWVRLDFDWSWLQTRRGGTPDWVKIDRVVASAQAHKIALLPILVYTPVWARSEGCVDSSRCPPKDPADFAAFAQAAVARYAPKGIHHWEIWNEPNMRGSWLPAANASEYTRLLSSAYEAIKKQDPTATVVTGGLGPIGSGNGNIAPVEYVDQLYAAGAKKYFDAIGFHPYSFPVLPSEKQSWNAWQQMSDTRMSVRSIMIANGDSAKKIWVTEYGAPTNGPGKAASMDRNYLIERTDHVTEELQAAMLTDSLKLMRTHDWAGPLFWYSYKDMGESADTTENFFGVIRANGSQKPAYAALKER